ncbi:NADPH-quinone reductase [Liquorilactobacillus ghanensis DSM 18630]|jgi:putative NADPH-quinone reductase|uniref:NADPH-quinone reductase n=2 Tax=Liquorilactobacillus ghanensis TaxID=399370 RepID=A0A0R1VUQ0_9LACO|nr:NAD(P)H-dependent oxidoreductase [Liquorilactobacillus ghanensis]KRM06454.1 NADPH-quinone reductase [Liquorilactobacillus ghanensis DSM 18630]
MQTLIIVGHPTPAASATQQFLKAAVQDLREINWHELADVKNHFDQQQEQLLLQKSSRIVLQFPLYWYNIPNILKRWQDQVLTETLQAKLAGKELGIVVNLGKAARDFQLGGSVGFSLSALLSPLAAMAKHFQMRLLPLFVIDRFGYQTQEQRQHLLVAYQQFLELPQPATFAQREDWFLAKLKEKKLQATGQQQQQLELIEQQLLARTADLADLQAVLHPVKEDDEAHGR